MMIPTIHLNGTKRDDLIEDQMQIMSALRAAITVMSNNGPNARDYYPQGPSAFEAAREEHVARIHKLKDVLQEVTEFARAIVDA
jgi:hypothetical protein